ncbi:MAG: hypothetical protein ACI9TH_001227 [Kiritimatiellia bacterium]|jgi:hypothetical protein
MIKEMGLEYYVSVCYIRDLGEQETSKIISLDRMLEKILLG